jgi:hypothetical protein
MSSRLAAETRVRVARVVQILAAIPFKNRRPGA